MNTDIQNRLLNYEVPPPQESWDRIAAALDEGALQFPGKLYRFEQQPPKDTWNKIEKDLDQENQPSRVITIGKPYKKLIQYAGIAAAIIVIAFLSMPLFKYNPGGISPADNIITTIPSKLPQSTVENPVVNDAVVEEENNSNRKIIPAQEKRWVSSSRLSKKQRPPEEQEPLALLDFLPTASVKNDMIAYQASVDNYMIYTDDDGHAMKLPKKLFEAFECATREIACRKKIKDLQQRVASSAVSSDFTGVLEMLRNLQENQ